MLLSSMITTVDTHTMGEPTRVVTGGVGPIPGPDMPSKKRWLSDHNDRLRRFLLWEPRGHRDMFGAVLTEPTSPEADIGVLFMDSGGYLDMCGHGSIGSTVVLLETGILTPATNHGETHITLDTPAGLIQVRAQMSAGRCQWVSIRNQPAFWHSTVHVRVDGKEVPVDIAYGGNFFGLVEASSVGLAVAPGDLPALTATGLALRERVNGMLHLVDPGTGYPSEVALIEFYEESDPPSNVVVFGSGQVDRSPCGTGTCAKMALLHKKGRLRAKDRYTQRGILGTEFYGAIVRETEVDSRSAIVPEITGRAFITGLHRFVADPDDPLQDGFQLFS